jgi:8-oxo-dGTP pyrophosphatase MutT (NUDIX family)
MNIKELAPPKDTYFACCMACHSGPVEQTTVEGKRKVRCHACGKQNDRAVIVDPRIAWWADDAGEYWHETAGVFVRDTAMRFLFFERTAFPHGLTVPAGHVETAEDPDHAAARELREEVGLVAGRDLRFVVTVPIPGDSCRRGSDAHVWHVRLLTVPEHTEITVNEEGAGHSWLTLAEAMASDITYAVRRIIGQHTEELLRP